MVLEAFIIEVTGLNASREIDPRERAEAADVPDAEDHRPLPGPLEGPDASDFLVHRTMQRVAPSP